MKINFDWFSCRGCKRYTLKWRHAKAISYAHCKCGFVLLEAVAIDRRRRA